MSVKEFFHCHDMNATTTTTSDQMTLQYNTTFQDMDNSSTPLHSKSNSNESVNIGELTGESTTPGAVSSKSGSSGLGVFWIILIIILIVVLVIILLCVILRKRKSKKI